MADDHSLLWFVATWVVLGLRAAYRAGARAERARRAPPPPVYVYRPAPGLAPTAPAPVRDGMTVEEASSALGVTPDKFREMVRR